MRSIIHRCDRITVKLAGRLVGSCAEDLPHATFRAAALEIDLSDLTFADRGVERSLVSLRRMGATFRAEGGLAQTLCRRMRLPLSP
jgi:hypothetical protein